MAAEAQGRSCNKNWLEQQRADLEELSQTLLLDADDDHKLRLVVSKCVEHYGDYAAQRFRLSEEDAPFLFCPVWCSSYENSFAWLAGCRPSMGIRLLYALSGSQLQAQLEEHLSGVRRGNLAELSALQLNMVHELHMWIVREEENLSDRMANLQDEVVDEPLISIAAGCGSSSSSSSASAATMDDQVDCAMNALASTFEKILKDADKLRLSTLTSLVDIFTPRQAVDFLIAAKQIHFTINEWGKRRRSRGWKDPLLVI